MNHPLHNNFLKQSKTMTLADIRPEQVDPLLSQIKNHMSGNSTSLNESDTDTPVHDDNILMLDQFAEESENCDESQVNFGKTEALDVISKLMKDDSLDSDILSEYSAKRSAQAFASLASAAKIANNTSGSHLPLTHQEVGQQTVETLMRELLKPMLKDWLDAHLPSLVKWLVAEQIEKLMQQYQETIKPTTSSKANI